MFHPYHSEYLEKCSDWHRAQSTEHRAQSAEHRVSLISLLLCILLKSDLQKLKTLSPLASLWSVMWGLLYLYRYGQRSVLSERHCHSGSTQPADYVISVQMLYKIGLPSGNLSFKRSKMVLKGIS